MSLIKGDRVQIAASVWGSDNPPCGTVTSVYLPYVVWVHLDDDSEASPFSPEEVVLIDVKHDDEVRITSETGGQKGQKLAQLGCVDPSALLQLARVAGHGSEKYDRFNYLRGYDWSLSFDALMRHALAFWSGEDTDPESNELHMAHAAWHCLALVSFVLRDLGSDNRPPGKETN